MGEVDEEEVPCCEAGLTMAGQAISGVRLWENREISGCLLGMALVPVFPS